MGYVARLHFFVSRNRIAAAVLTPDLGDTAPHAQKDFAARKFFFLFSVLPFPRRLPRLSELKARRIAVKKYILGKRGIGVYNPLRDSIHTLPLYTHMSAKRRG